MDILYPFEKQCPLLKTFGSNPAGILSLTCKNMLRVHVEMNTVKSKDNVAGLPRHIYQKCVI